MSESNNEKPSVTKYLEWINEDYPSLFIGLFIVFLAMLGLLDWVTW